MNNRRKQRRETTQTASPTSGGDPYAAVRSRLAVVAGELRKAAETADSAREGLLALAQRFEQHAQAGDNK